MSVVTGTQLAAHFCDLLVIEIGSDGLATTLSRIDMPNYDGREPFDGLADANVLLLQAYADLAGDPITDYTQYDLFLEALYRARRARYDPSGLG